MARRTRGDGQSSLQIKFDEALIMQKKGGHKGALKRLQLILKQNPSHPQVLNLYSLSLAETGNVAKAKQALEKAVKCDPEHAASWANLGLILEREYDLQSAAGAFGRFCKLSPDNLRGLIRYGDACLDLDRFEESEQTF